LTRRNENTEVSIIKNRISIIVGLLALGAVNVCTTYAQPFERAPLPPAPTDPQIRVPRAVASAQILAFATETMRSQSTPEEFARWPLALRDALPYWLEYQPFEVWPPELQKFAVGKFQALAADEIPTYAENKAAVDLWVQEKAPLDNAQLRFFSSIKFILVVNNQDGLTQYIANQSIELTGRETREIVAAGGFFDSLSPEQKSELFAHQMKMPLARLTPEQKQIFAVAFNANTQAVGGVPIIESANADIITGFHYSALVQRMINNKKDNFDVTLAAFKPPKIP
jgi:hypothetical protein